MEKRISGHTGLLALIGSPVGHSGSPAMYNYSFEKLGLDYAYVAFDIKVEQVKEALSAMKLFRMRGMNVTMPCKTEAAKYMDELSLAARIIGAVNTIVNEDGRLVGYITDGEGFVNNLKDHGIDVRGKKVAVAGGGGAATAIQVQCALDGARELAIFNIKDDFFARTIETAEKIRNEVSGIVVNVYDIADTAKMTEEIAASDIFVNATIVGMKPMENERSKTCAHFGRALWWRTPSIILRRPGFCGRPGRRDVPASAARVCCYGRGYRHLSFIPARICRWRK